MAEKRPLGTLGPVMYGKLPRLEADSRPGHSLPPSAGNQDPCSYKGAYFSCPLGGAPKAGSERLASWTPYPPLYPTSVAGPPLRADNLLTSCLLYRSPAESAEKVQDSGPVELLPFSPQTHSFPGPPLAAPKPVYRNPLCYGLSTCLGEGAAKRPLDVDWTLVTGPLIPPADPPCSLTSAPSKGQPLDGTFLRGVPAGGSGKDSSVSFSPCQAFLEKYRAIHSTSFLTSKYTGPYSGDPKQALSEVPPSPWTQLAQPLGPGCQDAVPTHYPLPHPTQALPCPPACRHPEKPGSYSSVLPMQPLGAHKGPGYPAGGLGNPYLRQQAAQTPYMSPVGLDTYSYPSGPLPAPSPGLKVEPPLAPRCPLDFVPQTLSFPYARDDLSLYGASPGLRGTPPSQSSVQTVPQPSAFQQPCQPLPASQPCSEPVRSAELPVQEAEEKLWLPEYRKERLQPQLSEHPGAPIVIRDSPIPCTPPALPPCAQERQPLPHNEGALPPSSPPMPIIDNVFSLAPYRDYLDVQAPAATAESDQAPAKSHDKDYGGTLPAPEPPSRTHCSLREEVALDLSVKKPVAETPPLKAPSPAVPAKPTAAVDVPGMDSTIPDMPGMGSTVSDLPGLKTMVTEAPGLPGVPVTTEATPRTNFHSSVAFMFRKFKILRPAPLPATVVPSVPASAPAPPVPAPPVPTPTSAPVGLQVLTQPLPVTCFNLALPSPPAVAVASPTLAPTAAPALAPVAAPARAPTPAVTDSPEQRFTGLHASLCDAISGSVAHSPPEKLREWLEMAGPWGQAAWQDCQGVQGLLGKLLSQLQSFVCTQQCPFPHVVRAGAIFVPIHLVKERLFPRLPPGSVDHVLQEHRVELRPTTLSEERALRERALHGCTSRMLKLLALRQLPDIYPDLLGLQWRDCVRRQLGDFDSEAGSVPPSEPTMTREEPASLALAWKSPASKAKKPGKKLPVPGSEKAEVVAGRGSCDASPPPTARSSPPGPTLKARFRSLLETAWLNGLALPTWGHKASGADRPAPRPPLLGGQNHH
ncbi:uncharacterized protein C15orf39-like isoform X1 [Talpa occidentalis]|uniref:uncharacterized protein C15orf39-like isoform X1 n=1 Tax=Talpa occidentalis TaxID=50954 RepID=UPI00188E4D08|nr:uncharacterized protein C15orf39-like isoform X1 [Talpa occidentalis]XP_037369067.1 uncharacterized protein C15orf39-like isoform X1 [Talpa occidentalis]